jgi:hypothetical protein
METGSTAENWKWQTVQTICNLLRVWDYKTQPPSQPARVSMRDLWRDMPKHVLRSCTLYQALHLKIINNPWLERDFSTE